MAKHFQYKFEVFFKEIILDGSLGQTKYYLTSIEFQGNCSPNINSFIWIFNAPNTQNEAAYIEFIQAKITPQLSEHLNDPELFDLVKIKQVHVHSITCWKYNKNRCHFSYGQYFTEKKALQKISEILAVSY